MSVVWAALGVAVLLSGPSPSARRLGRTPPSWRAGRWQQVKRPVPLALCAVATAWLVVGLPVAIAAAITAATVIRRMRRTQECRRDADEREAISVALDVVISELLAGAHPARACQQAASDADPGGEVATILAQCGGRAELGGDVAAGIRDYVTGTESVVAGHLWLRVAVAWETATTHGLPMAEVLATVRSDLLARKSFAAQTAASLAGPRATATVLALLPLIGIGLGQMMGASPLTVLTGSGLGGYLLVAGALLVSAGLWWADSIADRVGR